MIRSLWARLQQGHRTSEFPLEEPVLPALFRGLPQVDTTKCNPSCTTCVSACPADALTKNAEGKLRFDLGRCLFCTDCAGACTGRAIEFTKNYRLSACTRTDLQIDAGVAGNPLPVQKALEEEMLRLFGRSLKLRQVSAGGCNGCEVDTNVLNTLVFDLSRFGIQFVASPRHADGILVTGTVPENMFLALKKTYDAIPAPKIVIATGACAISGGLFANHEQTKGPLDKILPVDLYIPGCPPHPYTILDGLLRLLARR